MTTTEKAPVRGGGNGSTRQAGPVYRHSNSTPRVVRSQVSGAVVGHINSDGWLVKTGLDPNKHRLRVLNAWCTDTAHLELAIRGVRLGLLDSSVWEADLDTWRRHGIPWHTPAWGRQAALPQEHWTCVRQRAPGVKQLVLVEDVP